ncbi:MAG: RagB/SusD family nutrient uptake outer membrane protein [Bacteroides xylanisolvens]
MKLRYIILPLVTVLVCSSCNYLDFDETNGLNTKEYIYNYFNKTKQMLTNVYSYMPQDFGAIDGAMRDCGSDDAEYAATGATIQYFNNGNWSELKTVDDCWSLYKGIRAANEFITSVAEVDLSRYQYDPSFQNNSKQLKLFPYEARVLRAFYYFELARRYGDIPMPQNVMTPEEANNTGKTSFDEIVDFIVSECNDAATNLPETYIGQPNNETGRVTKGFAMALKSKALLYKASLLHNPTMNTERWKASAKAALDIINLNLYQLDPKEKANSLNSKEVVLFRMNNNSSYLELCNFPIRFTEGKRGTPALGIFPSQNLVDAFKTVNGYRVSLTENGWECEDPVFDPQNPYDGRDPRFYWTILANGMSFKGNKIETFTGGKDYAPVNAGGSATGYFLRKYIQETTSFVPDQEVTNKHHWIIYRYAETLLTYAESMIGAFNSVTYKDATYNKTALEALNEVCANAGMPLITTTDKDEFIRALRNEWRVEFAFEDHRFWDIRRWKIGDSTQKELNGVTITKTTTGLSFQKTLYENRSWTDRMYLYPIPQEELFKNKNLYPQNSGW